MKISNSILFAVSNIVQDISLLFENSIQDIQIKEVGSVVEVIFYYTPSSKYDVWRIRKKFLSEKNILTFGVKNNKICAKLLAPKHISDIIVCKKYAEVDYSTTRILNELKQKTQATRKSSLGIFFIYVFS